MNIPVKIGFVVLGLSMATSLAPAAARRQVIPLAKPRKPMPSDQALLAHFLAHRADFEKLVAMANKDSRLSRIAPDFTWLNDNVAWPRKDIGISEERWNDYRQMFRRVGAPDGIIKRVNPSRIMFPIVSWGLVPAGSEKGLVYSQVPLTPVLKSLDKRPPDKLWDGPDRSHLLAYEPISERWYIYYEQW